MNSEPTAIHWGVRIIDAADGLERVIDHQIRERPARLAAAQGCTLLQRDAYEEPDGQWWFGPWRPVGDTS